MTTPQAHEHTRILVQAAAKACEDKKGEDTRILELDPIDSGLSDFFLITSALNDRQAQAIAEEIEFTLKRDYGVYATSVEGRRQGDWILLDYIDFVVHVFRAERRAFYDIERLRKSARPLTPSEFDAELKAALAAKTRATRSKSGVPGDGSSSPGRKSSAKAAPTPSPATKPKKVTAKAHKAPKPAPAKKAAAPAGKRPTARKAATPKRLPKK
jgi:ribosome-associated protein